MAGRRRCWGGVILFALVNSFAGHAGWVQPLAAAPPTVSTSPWAGIYPTVLTPFCDKGGVDVGSLEHQLRYELAGGVRGLLVLGTIGEGQYTSDEERGQVIATAVRVAGLGVPVVAGIHTCQLDKAQAQMHQAAELGAAAVLVKYVGNPRAPAGEVLGFFAALSDQHVLPIFYYHYPSQTGLRLTPDDVAGILGLPGVVGIKESTLNLREVQAHLYRTRGLPRTFLSGTALNLTQFMDLGGQGAMCPEAVLLPGPTVQAYAAYTHGRHDEARCYQAQLFDMLPILSSRPTPPMAARVVLMSAEDHKLPVPMGHDQPQARIKDALNGFGVPTPVAVKCPLPPLTPRDHQRVQTTVSRLRAIDWCEVALKVPPAPWRTCPENDEAGAILKTGAFQLGPNVGRDLLRSQSDGEGGFFGGR
jgi:dihydrodipicolinate synthase/N-acetylneuraminate lyase